MEKLVLNTQKILAKIFLPKKILKSKMSHPPKNPTITPVTWNPEYPPPLPGQDTS